MPTYSPARPPTERDLVQSLNGTPVFLGTLVSTGAAVNNATTATPFNGPPAQGGFLGSLAGRVLLVQTTAAGSVLPSASAALTLVQQTATFSLAPPIAVPGVLLGASATQVVTMPPNAAYLQWLPVTGAANLLVWELV